MQGSDLILILVEGSPGIAGFRDAPRGDLTPLRRLNFGLNDIAYAVQHDSKPDLTHYSRGNEHEVWEPVRVGPEAKASCPVWLVPRPPAC